jgi:FAD binding domain
MPGQAGSDQHRYRIVGLLPEGAGEHPTFESVRPDAEAHGLAHIEAVHWFSSYRVHHRVAEHFRSGRVFLLGDAAHVHTPVGGQGMNTGLGDAVNLAWKLAQVVQGGHAALLNTALLDTFEPERRPFARRLVNTTDRLFGVIVRRSAFARFIRTRAIPFVFPLITRWRAVRRLLFLTVSQTRIEYRSSALSGGSAGRIRGGDRLPWVQQPGGSNFGALRSLSWQVHVYGVPGPEVVAWCARRELELKVSAFDQAAGRAGLREDAVYLIRPDGYVGWAAAAFNEAAFDSYAGCWLPEVSALYGLRLNSV